MSRFCLYGASLVSLTALMAPAYADNTDATPAGTTANTDQNNPIGEIIVTAQKREQSINDIGMSITAATGDQLADRGITGPEDLGKIVPGFVYTASGLQTPVYSIRGIGFYESSLAAAPAVSVYMDQAPLVSPMMTLGSSLDIERVEVLKGPQGTLFGENSTGGAVNYIAAKPTPEFESGASVSAERFGLVDDSGYVSGPITDTLRARLSVRTVEGGAWQESQTRPGDTLGNERKLMARLLLDWTPTDRWTVSTNFNGYRDRSDTQALALVRIAPVNPTLAIPALLNAPLAPANARDADWSAGNPMQFNNTFWQGSARVDYQLTDTVKVTSLSTYSNLETGIWTDNSGTSLQDEWDHEVGSYTSFNQEVRVAGIGDRVNWVAGANYEHDRIDDNNEVFIDQGTITTPVQAVPAFADVPPISTANAYTNQVITDRAIFGNIEYRLTDPLTIQAGARYTESRDNGMGCSYDPTGVAGQNFEALEKLFIATGAKTSPYVPIAPGQCYIFNSTLTPVLGAVPEQLDENNWSWRVGPTYKFPNGMLAYANYSRGYKQGSIPQINASTASEYTPAKQERVDAYETGLKTPLLSGRVHTDSAVFYYAYTNKQIRGDVVDPVFGALETLVNIPKSAVWGVEEQLTAEPVTGLTFNGGITYINAKITGPFEGVNREGDQGNFDGSPLPYSPKLLANADAQYEWSLTNGMRPFFGASLMHQSEDNTTFTSAQYPASAFDIKAYTTLDLRAGIASRDGKWRVMLYGRNVTNTYYWTGVTQGLDTDGRYIAKPAVYGITVSFRTR
jgi:iron complex outermembrane receptor protein